MRHSVWPYPHAPNLESSGPRRSVWHTGTMTTLRHTILTHILDIHILIMVVWVFMRAQGYTGPNLGSRRHTNVP